ncbi:DsbA family protein [Nocardia sp. NPDC088792]|uniref:DsbA family protein n=1 Tax=Nocardia sp. NPDC088792 TaxID=3364332 RepID=UPI0037FD5E2B
MSRMPKSRAQKKSADRKALAGLAILAAIGLLVIAGIQMLGHDKKSDQKAAPAAVETNPAYERLAKLARRDANDPMAQGRTDAPVVMVEYSDFQCPYCRLFGKTIEPDLVRRYVDAGVLRIEWRNFAIFGPESVESARASWAAGRQGKFWEFHKTLMENAPEKKNTGALTPDRLADLAALAGVPDIAKFRADEASPASQQAVQADLDEGYNIGVSSTPAFLINGRPVLGAQPLEQFSAVIDAARAAAENAK